MATYDAVVVMGSGFQYPDRDDILDCWGCARLGAAFDALMRRWVDYIILTGGLRHDQVSTRRTFAEVAMDNLLREGIQAEKILTITDLRGYIPDTHGDVERAIAIADEHGCKNLLVATEAPHWLRVSIFFKRKAPHLRVTLLVSMPAPWWYWWKERLAAWALRRSPKGEKSLLYFAIGACWRLISPLFLPNYVVRRYQWR